MPGRPDPGHTGRSSARRRRAVAVAGWTLAAAVAVGLVGYSIAAVGSEGPARIAGPSDPTEAVTGTPAPEGESSEPTQESATPEATDGAGQDDAGQDDDQGPEVAEDAALADQEQPVAEPVALDEPAAAGPFTVSVSKVAAIQGEAEGIGEVAGPAIRFVLTVRNTSKAALPLDAAVVTVEYGDDAIPATQLSQSGAKDFPDTVAAGASGSGTFVFQVPTDERDSVRILFNHSASEPVVAFEGAAPTRKG